MFARKSAMKDSVFLWETFSSLNEKINSLLTLLKGLLIEEVHSSLKARGQFPLIIKPLGEKIIPWDAIKCPNRMKSSAKVYTDSEFWYKQLTVPSTRLRKILSAVIQLTELNGKEQMWKSTDLNCTL